MIEICLEIALLDNVGVTMVETWIALVIGHGLPLQAEVGVEVGEFECSGNPSTWNVKRKCWGWRGGVTAEDGIGRTEDCRSDSRQ